MLHVVNNEMGFIDSSWFSYVVFFFIATNRSTEVPEGLIECLYNMCSYTKSSLLRKHIARNRNKYIRASRNSNPFRV